MGEPEALSKRIIICCDGTWQSATDGKESIPSNVTRLARSLARVGVDKTGKKWQQVVWYDSGVGTTSGPLGRALEGAVGQGLEGNVIEAYNFCVLNYSPGDQIMCFGFSRGAYTARSIAGLISDIGVCKPSALKDFHEIWRLYKENNTGERFYGSREYYNFIYGVLAPPEKQPQVDGLPEVWERKPHESWKLHEEASRDIEVVGVWDTVGALGSPVVLGYQPKLLFGPDKLGYHNVKLSPNIKRAFQALAIDEHRKAFAPTVWHLPEPEETKEDVLRAKETKVKVAKKKYFEARENPKLSQSDSDQLKDDYIRIQTDYNAKRNASRAPSDLLQVWFPGVHINSGGGSSDTLTYKGDLEELSNMTFSWMLDQIDEYVTINREAYIEESRDRLELYEMLNAQAKTNENLKTAAEKKRAESSWGSYLLDGAKSVANKIAHPMTPAPSTKLRGQDWGTGEIIDSYTPTYYLNGWIRRTPGNYTKDNKGKKELGNTNEFIHPSVGYRMAMSKSGPDKKQSYLPGAFAEDDFRREPTTTVEGYKYQYIVKGSLQPITEYKLKEGRGSDNIPYERYAVIGDRAQKYVSELDKEYGYSKQKMGNSLLPTKPKSTGQ